MDLNVDEIELILDYLSYQEIKNFALAKKSHLDIVRHYLRHAAKVAKAVLERNFPGSTKGLANQDLINRVYHLTGTKDANGIEIVMDPPSPDFFQKSTIYWKCENKVITTEMLFGKRINEKWYLDKRYHSIDGPAVIEWDAINHKKTTEEWYLNGNLHRADGPARQIWQCRAGHLTIDEWYLNGNRHREDGPAITTWGLLNGGKTSEIWYLNGNRHRVDGPADIMWHAETGSKSYEAWYLNGNRHRGDGPAETTWYLSGKTSENWYLNGKHIPKNIY